MAFLEGAFQCYGGVWHFGGAFWGMTFWKRRLEGCGIFGGHLQCCGGVLAVFWRGVAYLEGTCYVLEGCLQCFGGVWHFWRALVVFAYSVLEVHDILEEALPVFWRGVAFLEGTCRVLEGCGIV